jgi:hypothetical protein
MEIIMGAVLRLVGRYLGAAPWKHIPRRVQVASAAIVGGVVLIMALAAAGGTNGLVSQSGMPALPTARPAPDGTGGGPQGLPAARSQAAFNRIILPDLLIVRSSGLTRAQIAGLRQISGVRNVISFDGAQISAAGRPASVIGVSPDQFRSWVPLGTATDQNLWNELAGGAFIESSQVTGLPRLSPGHSYLLTGATSLRVRFAAAAPIGISGIDLLVNQAVSRELGLVHRVAALISAPGPSIATLIRQVRVVLGPGARVVDLRDRRLPAATVSPGHITSYLQLFRASAATYCPAMSWTILAAIGQIESADGQNMGPSSAGALGPMQFLPSTWAQWGIDGFGPSGPPDIMNPLDAVPSAARMLCADGASSGTETGLRQAIFAYNHANWYVSEVLALAAQYAAEYH